MAQKCGDMPSKSNEAESEKDYAKSSLSEITRTIEYGLIEIDKEKLLKKKVEKLKREMLSLSLDETIEENTTQKVFNEQLLREKVREFSKMLEEDENSAKQTEPEKSVLKELKTETEFKYERKDENSAKQTEPEKGVSKELKTETELTEFKYERKNKRLDKNSHLRRMCKEFEEVSIIEEKLNVGENMMRGIAYPKRAEKHFSPKFPWGENVDISVDHFEFGHEELPINFLELFESKDCLKERFPFDLEKDPKINNIVPSFIKFLLDEYGYGYKYPEKCFIIILAILKNPYRKIEVFFNEEPVVKEQIAMAEYLVNCLLISEIYDEEDAYEKLTEAIIMFANVHSFFLAHIIAGFHTILGQISDDKNMTQNYNAYQIYCKVLNLMISLGATVIRLCLPPHFEKISCLASADENCDLYFHLLRACEILIANTIEQESRVKAESSDDINLVLFYTACYNYFERDLTTHLIPVFKKYEKRKVREEQYLSKKHDILPTKIGYMNSDMRYLRRNTKEPESPKLPSVNESPFNSEGKDCFSNTQFGYVIKEDIQELSLEDKNYYNTIVKFSLSNLEV